MAVYDIANTVTIPATGTRAALVAAAVNASAPAGAIAVSKTQALIGVIVATIEAVTQSTTPVGTFYFQVTGNPGGAGQGTCSVRVRWTS